MSNILIHQKVIDPVIYPDSGEAGKLQPSDYNAGHKFTGGANGQVLVRDSTDATYGAAWTSFPTVDGGISSLAAPGSPVNGQWWFEVSGTSPAQITKLQIRVNGATLTLSSRTD